MNPLVNLDRRDFLKATTGLLTGVVVGGTPLAMVAKSPAWAVDLTTFTSSEAATLLAVTRSICPHDKLADLAYALVIQAIDAQVRGDDHTHQMIKDGLAALGPTFASSSETDRVATLKKLEPSDFFQFLRLKIVQTLYTSPIAYAYFGYEGEAFSKGGYSSAASTICVGCPKCPADRRPGASEARSAKSWLTIDLKDDQTPSSSSAPAPAAARWPTN